MNTSYTGHNKSFVGCGVLANHCKDYLDRQGCGRARDVSHTSKLWTFFIRPLTLHMSIYSNFKKMELREKLFSKKCNFYCSKKDISLK